MSILNSLARLLHGRPTIEVDPAPTRVAVELVEPVEIAASDSPDTGDIPRGVRVAAGWSWRLLLIAGLVIGIGWALAYFSAVSIPIAVAILLTALLHPLLRRLASWGWPPVVSAIVALVGSMAVILGVFWWVGSQVASEWPSLLEQSLQGIQELLNWLANGPLAIDATQLQGYLDQLREWLVNSRAQIAGYAATVGAKVGNFLAGFATVIMATFFFSFQGRSIWRGSVDVLLPSAYREATDRAALRGWTSLSSYMRAAVAVAAVDAAGVSLVALVLQLPMVAALFALTFFMSLIPVVGAVIAGTVATLLALVTHDWVSAAIMLGGTIAVMQLEGNLLQPLLLGRAVDLHPLAVLLGLLVGATLAGIVGALLVIPVLAFLVAFLKALRDPAALPESLPTRTPRRARK